MAGAKSKVKPADISMPGADPLAASAIAEPSAVLGYLGSIAMTAIATLIAVGVDSGVRIPNLSLIFVVPVVIAGVGFGLGPSLCSALLGALAYNFFLTEPRYSLAVDDPANIWAIGLLFLVGLIVSGVAFTSRLRATDAAILRRQEVVVQDYCRAVLAAASKEDIVSATAKALATLFQIPVIVMVFSQGDVVSVDTVGDLKPREAEFAAAREALETGAVARAGVYPSSDSRFDFWPVTVAPGQHAVLGLAFDPGERPATGDMLVDIVTSVLALALSRQHFRVSDDIQSAP